MYFSSKVKWIDFTRPLVHTSFCISFPMILSDETAVAAYSAPCSVGKRSQASPASYPFNFAPSHSSEPKLLYTSLPRLERFHVAHSHTKRKFQRRGNWRWTLQFQIFTPLSEKSMSLVYLCVCRITITNKHFTSQLIDFLQPKDQLAMILLPSLD